jgi:UDP-N-acetylglucosamine--N-acetylmuramyl-(pentapeptide) pyrophosphoryl-undecaprenol N-acetylglucosamine transferase
MASAMAESHLVLSRAGAITLAELCAAGRPSLLLPLEAAGGHQKRNAERLVAAGAARLADGASTPEAFAEMLAGLLADRARLTEMADAARRLGRADSAAKIADRLEFWAARRRGKS